MIGFAEYWIDWETMSGKVTNIKVAESGYAFLIDQEAKIVAHPVSEKLGTQFTEEGNSDLEATIERMKAGEQGTTQMEYEGKEVYLSYAPITETGWSMAVIVPVNEIVEPADEIRDHITLDTHTLTTKGIVLVIVALIVVLIVSIILARSIALPIKKLTAAGKKIADGKLDTKIPEVKTKDEVSGLGETMNLLVGAVKFLKKDKKK